MELLHKHNIKPCVLGLPTDLDDYPTAQEENCTDLSLWEQMELVRGSDLVISCDSWSKNLSAFASIPTIIMKNFFIRGGKDFEDPADPIFVDYWTERENSTVTAIRQQEPNSIELLKTNIEGFLHSMEKLNNDK